LTKQLGLEPLPLLLRQLCIFWLVKLGLYFA